MDYYTEVTRPIDDAAPCGISLEDDHGLEALYFKAEGTPERYDGQNTIPAEPPNWRELEASTLEYLRKSKDLNLIVLLSQIALNTKGLSAFSDCIRGLAEVVADYWQELFPELDPDDNDAIERLSALGNLMDKTKTLTPLKQTALANSKVFGNISLHDVEVVQGVSTASNDRDLTEEQLYAIFKDTNQEALQTLNAQISQCRQSLQALHIQLEEKVGVGQGVNFTPLSSLLDHILSTFSKYAETIEEELEPQAETDPEQETTNVPKVKALSGEINSRADVERAIDKICDYFQKNEPSSPVPLLLNRAKQLINKNFMEIINDVAPEGAEQVKKLSGIE